MQFYGLGSVPQTLTGGSHASDAVHMPCICRDGWLAETEAAGNRDHESFPILMLACYRLGTSQEAQALAQIRMNKQHRFFRHRATVILWQPPMASNRCRVHLL